jgi:RNA recognition motif-containing protein
VDPRKAKNRSQARAECKKIFLGGLDTNLPEKDIRAIFSKYGKIDTVELPYDNLNQCRRRFGFVVFENPESALAACKEPKQVVGQTEVDVRLSKPNNNNNGGNGNNGPRQFYNNGAGRSRGAYGNGMVYGMNNDAGDYNASGRVYGYDNTRNVGYNMDSMYRVPRY